MIRRCASEPPRFWWLRRDPFPVYCQWPSSRGNRALADNPERDESGDPIVDQSDSTARDLDFGC